MRTIASVGSSIAGSATVSTRTSRFPCQVTALIPGRVPRRQTAKSAVRAMVSPGGSVGPVGDDAPVDSPTQVQVVRAEGRSGRMVRIRIWLQGAMWFPVLGANVVAVALGVTLPFLDDTLGDQPALPINLSAVEQILGAIAAGMITFTGIVFSAVLLAAQLQTTSYSPRLAARLRRDPVVIAALALPTATASYAMFALAAIGRQADESGQELASALTVGVALLLAFRDLRRLHRAGPADLRQDPDRGHLPRDRPQDPSRDPGHASDRRGGERVAARGGGGRNRDRGRALRPAGCARLHRPGRARAPGR